MLLHYIGGFILKKQILVKGNIIRLEKGMKIKVQVPTKFLYVNRPFSNKLEQITICLGDILVKRPADTKNLEISILEIFEQQERVRKGWFPKNPRRKYPFDNE